MKLLLFSDVHNDLQACRSLVERSAAADVVVGAGDFGWFRSGLDRAIGVLQAIEKPSILVPGNCETERELRAASRQWPSSIVLHGSLASVDDVPFYGLGGGIPLTPFGPQSFDFDEATAAGLLTGCPQNAILVTHSPPRGGLDVASGGQSLGSSAVRDVVLACSPRLVVCGHIHASSGRKILYESSILVNAGPSGMMVEIAI